MKLQSKWQRETAAMAVAVSDVKNTFPKVALMVVTVVVAAASTSSQTPAPIRWWSFAICASSKLIMAAREKAAEEFKARYK